MKIKQALDIDEFRNIWEKTQLNLEFTYKHTETKIKDVLSQHDLTFQQMRFLNIVFKAGDQYLNLRSIKEKLVDKNADISRLANRLVEKGFIKKMILSGDKRNAAIILTSSGQKVITGVQQDVKLFDRIFYNLSKKEAKQLNMLLDKLRE